MPPVKAIFLSLLLGMLCLKSAHAEHIIGGEMYYECIGEGEYLFTMKLFRDCFTTGANFDNPGNFALYDQDNNLVTIVQATVQSVQNVNTNVASPCMVLPPNICVEEGTYTFEITVPDPSQIYSVVYQRCCRNATIQNLVNPGAQGLTIQSTIAPFGEIGCNSSPSFNNFPPPVLCAQELLEFDHSATDLDGDSLAYSLCSPLIGGTQVNPLPVPPSNPPYDQVIWGGPFNALNPLPADPGLTIDPITGLLSGVPTQLGQYVIGVCVEEWRDGQLLSVNTRDFQFNVAFCAPPSDAIINIPDVGDLCQGLTVNFSSSSAESNIFHWDFGDPDGSNPTSDLISPTYTFSDTGTYNVTLITNAGFFCSDTVEIQVPIFYAAQITASLAGFVCDGEVPVYSFSSTGVYEENAPVNWDFGPNASPATGSGSEVSGIIFAGNGPQNVSVEVLNNACSASDMITIEVAPPPEVTITPQSEFCTGYTYSFSQQSLNANNFLWDFGLGSDGSLSTQPNPAFTFPGDGEYTVTLTASGNGNCPVTVEEVFDIKSLLAPEVPSFPVQCFDQHSFNFSAEGSYSNAAEFSWSFENGVPATAGSESVNGVIFLETGSHPFSVTISENGCTRSAEGTVVVHMNPIAEFDATPRRGCAPLDVVFQNFSATQSSNASFTWDFGDGNGTAPFAATYTYTQPGIYSVSLNLQNLDGCIDSDSYTREAFIEVLPTPTPGFSVDPVVVSALDPVIHIADGSIGSTSCTYYFDGQVFEDCNFSHNLNNVLPQSITQRVTNGEGCSAEMSINIRVADHLIYIPNTFTPNGDGRNEIFEPVITGAMKYDMYIVDRWGREVFAQQDVQRGWDGGDAGGLYFGQAGIYQYIIVVTDYSGWNFEYLGHVTLAR